MPRRRLQRSEVTLEALGHLPNLGMTRRHEIKVAADIDPHRRQKVLLKTYEAAPADFESLLSIQGVGAKRLRALAPTSELIGGKDGTPFPVDRATYDRPSK